jgi:hypothetical protein
VKLLLDTVHTCGPACCCHVASRATAPPSTPTWGGIWVRRGPLDSLGALPRLRPAAAALVVRHPACGADGGHVEHPVRRSHAGCWQRRVQQRQGSAWARASVPKPIVSDQQPARAPRVPTPSRAALPPTSWKSRQQQADPERARTAPGGPPKLSLAEKGDIFFASVDGTRVDCGYSLRAGAAGQNSPQSAGPRC